MYGEKINERDLAFNLYIAGNIVCAMIGLVICDMFGRRFCFIFSFVISSGAVLMAYFSDNFLLKMAGLGITNGCTPIYSSLFTMCFAEISCTCSRG